MKSWWNALSITSKINIPIQALLIVVLSSAHLWIIEYINKDILKDTEKRAEILADGIINGMNSLMISGFISNSEYRRVFIQKMGASEKVKEIRIIRAKQVQDQFGIGLPEEQVKDDMDRHAIESRLPQFQPIIDQYSQTFRAVVPFIVSTNFRGTNCLACHHVEVGSANGAASIVLDMHEEFTDFQNANTLLWIGQLALQLLLFLSIQRIIQKSLNPLSKLQATMELMQLKGNMEQFVPIEIEKDQQDEISKLTESFNQMSESIRTSEKSMQLATLLYQSNTEAIVVTDENNHIVNVNPAFIKTTGYTLDDVYGKNPNIFKSGRHDKEFYRKMWQSLLTEGSWQGEIWSKRKNGEIFLEFAHFQILRRSDGSVFRHVAQFSDITENKKKDELIFRQANFDPLTGLPNRRLFYELLEHSLTLSKRNSLFGALMFINIDEFKSLNDALGYEYGDMLLVEVSNRLKSDLREMDTLGIDNLARFGGGFVVLIENICHDLEEAKQKTLIVAEKIRDVLAAPYQLNQHEYLSSSSVGVHLFDGKINSVDEVLKYAVIAMYQAKNSGKNMVRYFDSGQQELITHLGRYEIIKELGRGEMGVIYKAHDPLIERIVAVKVIDLKSLNKGEKDEYEIRFYQEAKAAGRLNHPNIITIHDLGKSGDIVYIAMELLEGPEIHDIISGVKQQPMVERLDIAFQVAIGLAYAHQNGIVHRDIKPSNLMILRGNHVKITDFGIAKLDSSKWRTQLGKIIGTPLYMSPEQCLSLSIDLRSDIFSLGIVLYQMLTGHHPYFGETTNSIMYQIVNEEPQKPSSFNSEIPDMLDNVVLKCLAKKPENRYQNADDLAGDLDSCRWSMIQKGLVNAQMTEGSDRIKILLIDDHVLFRDGLRYALQELGENVEILEAGSLSEGLDLAINSPDFDLLLLDYHLPDSDGFASVEQFYKHYPDTPIIVLSGIDKLDDVKKLMNIGAKGFIPKMLTRQEMIKALRLVLAGGIYWPNQLLTHN